ncbi:MAG: hypothetical protein GY711_31305 [bacterium]|nr:hypothetical protein [bacterium]
MPPPVVRSESAPSRRERLAVVAVALALLAVQSVVLLGMNLPELVRMIPDDSFFYLIIAERFREFGAFSFDGIHQTYGFQPLYQLVCIALAFVFREPRALLLAALFLGSLLHALSGRSLYYLVRELFGRFGAWGALVFWLANPALVVWFWSLKENALYAWLLILLAHELLRVLRSSSVSGGGWRLGLLAGGAALARVSFVPIWWLATGLLLLGAGLRRPLRARVKLVLVTSAAAVLVSGPWFLFAQLHFGSATPTSGLIKIAGTKAYVGKTLGLEWLSAEHLLATAKTTLAYLDQTFRAATGLWGPLVQGTVLAAVIACVMGWRRRAERGTGEPFATASSWTCGYVAVLAVANGYLSALFLPTFLAYGRWYTTPEFVALGVGVGWSIALAGRLLRSRADTVLLAACLVGGVLAWTHVRRVPWESLFTPTDFLETPPDSNQVLLEVGLWANRHLPEDVLVGARDPGTVTFFSRRRIVALDPLVNTYEFFRKYVRDATDFVRERGISYVFGPGVMRDGRYCLLNLRGGPHEVIWISHPEVDLGWLPGEPTHYMLARTLDAPSADFLGPLDFEYGAWVIDPENTERAAARDERIQRALDGFEVHGNILRMRLDPGGVASGGRAYLSIDGERVRDTAPRPDGWVYWDMTPYRGRRARVELSAGDAGDVLELYTVDLSFP